MLTCSCHVNLAEVSYWNEWDGSEGRMALRVLFYGRALSNIQLRQTPRVEPSGYGGCEQALGWETPRFVDWD